ncbi:MAG: hypothetical protein KKB81_08180 [Candidatus Margulisbacteria bacterium]|nr:hypothetical protein [Candidatus Margulisiibacteriota bacterium]MBU1021727.1 hypothetical protein [Candidatus Margulisiibacteriota bacterium]MBU1729473.1 hypothetical protein [Candidatus Margulisiibacteriota bacterium]MBU1955426.1 hypothetical protein [Candidatus Margulisiibacteriota bacterium]
MNKGYISIFLMMVMVVILAAVATAGSVMISNMKSNVAVEETYKLFYLAEAGIAYGIDKIKTSPGFYTDPPAGAPLKNWLVAESLGNTYPMAAGGFKIICPSSGGVFYSVGFLGGDIAASEGYGFIKIEFVADPFKVLKWERF